MRMCVCYASSPSLRSRLQFGHTRTTASAGSGAGSERRRPRAVRVVVLGDHNHLAAIQLGASGSRDTLKEMSRDGARLVVVVDDLVGAGNEKDAAIPLAQSNGHSARK